jgi:hypothetical protein
MFRQNPTRRGTGSGAEFVMGGLDADETVAVEARIAEELLRLTRCRRVGSQVVFPAPYVRRHAVEHAAAGQMLDERYLSARSSCRLWMRPGCGHWLPIAGVTSKPVRVGQV